MGEVYLATDGALGRQVAIKFVAPEKLELSLLGTASWKTVGTRRWTISTGTRKRDVLEIDVWSNTGSSRGEQTAGKGDPLVITYADGASHDVTLTVKNKRTVVTSDLDLKISKDGTVLRYRSATGYVQQIAIGGTSVCTYTNTEQFDSMTILDVRP